MGSELPDGWRELELSEITTTLESGSRPKGGVKGILSGVPSIGAEYLSSDGKFNINKVRYVSEEFFNSLNRGIIKNGDILIVKDGATTGKVSFVDQNFPFDKAAVNEHVFILRVDPLKCLQKYMFYFLCSKEGNGRLMDNFKGTAQGGINTQFINNFTMILPPLNVQKSIISRLDSFYREYDILRIEKEKANNNYEKISFVAFTKLLENIKNDTVSVSDVVLDMKYGSSTKAHSQQDGVPILRMNNITSNGTLVISDLKYVKLGESEERKYTLQKGDILINRTNSKELVGKCAVFNENGKYLYASYLIRIRVDTTKVVPEYLVFYLSVGPGREEINKKIRGVTNQWNINAEEIKTIPLLLPSLEDQKWMLSQFISLTKNIIIKAEQEKIINYLEILPQSVLSKAFKGELA